MVSVHHEPVLWPDLKLSLFYFLYPECLSNLDNTVSRNQSQRINWMQIIIIISVHFNSLSIWQTTHNWKQPDTQTISIANTNWLALKHTVESQYELISSFFLYLHTLKVVMMFHFNLIYIIINVRKRKEYIIAICYTYVNTLPQSFVNSFQINTVTAFHVQKQLLMNVTEICCEISITGIN